MKRLSVSLPPEIEKTIIDLRKTDEFCMCSCADILRKQVRKAMQAERYKCVMRELISRNHG